MTLTEYRHPAGLDAAVECDGDRTVLSFRGEADVFTLPFVIDVLTRVVAGRDGPVIVDLGETEFVDAATVRVLGRAWQFVDARGRSLTVRSPSRLTARLFSLFGLSHVIESEPTVAA